MVIACRCGACCFHKWWRGALLPYELMRPCATRKTWIFGFLLFPTPGPSLNYMHLLRKQMHDSDRLEKDAGMKDHCPGGAPRIFYPIKQARAPIDVASLHVKALPYTPTPAV